MNKLGTRLIITSCTLNKNPIFPLSQFPPYIHHRLRIQCRIRGMQLEMHNFGIVRVQEIQDFLIAHKKSEQNKKIGINNMNKETVLILGAVLVAIVGLVGISQAPTTGLRVGAEPKTVPYVDINSYLGVWYEQAVIPFYWERGCSKTNAKYSKNNDGTIRVDNSCVRNGKVVESIGKAIPEDSTNSKLKVEFVQTLDIGGQYWIVRLAKDYSYSVVSSPNYRYLWILYRQPVMPQALFDSIYADLKKDGFPVEKLVRTEQ